MELTVLIRLLLLIGLICISKAGLAEVEGFHEIREIFIQQEASDWVRVWNGDTVFIRKNATFQVRFKLPPVEGSDAYVRVLYQHPFQEGVGIRLYVGDPALGLEIPPIKDRYASFIAEKRYFGQDLYILGKMSALDTPIPYTILVKNRSDFFENIKSDERWIGYIIGIITIMCIYNLGMLLLFRRRYLAFYLIYALGALGQFVESSGLLGGANLARVSSVLTMWLAGSAIILFSIDVLEIKLKSNNLYKMGLGLVAVFSFLSIWGLLIGGIAARYFVLYAVPILIYCFALAARAAYMGYKPAYPMMLGWSGLLMGYALLGMQFFISGFPNMGWAPFIAVAFEIATFSFAMNQKLRLSELSFQRENQHAFNEMRKMVYPHQLVRIRRGESLENTMPTTTAQACVISFDIIGSSKIRHIKAKEFFRNVFAACNELMNEGYDGQNLRARAYRIKEMGDGFLCSVGYPFQSITDNPANDAIDLAEAFVAALQRESRILHSAEPIRCGIGIAVDTLTAFYPEVGTKEYDIFGQALVLATRYEGMRKVLFESEQQSSILIIQEVVYNSLDPHHRSGFTLLDIKQMGLVVRDDPAATKLFYKLLAQNQVLDREVQSKPLRAV